MSELEVGWQPLPRAEGQFPTDGTVYVETSNINYLSFDDEVRDAETSRYASNEAWEAVVADPALEDFFTAFKGQVGATYEDPELDAYLSRDPNEQSRNLVIRVRASEIPRERRLPAWRDLVQDAEDLWTVILRNRKENVRRLPVAILLW